VNREQQIRDARKLVDPQRTNPFCEDFIGHILDMIDRVVIAGRAGSKTYKKAVTRFQASLKRTELARADLMKLDLAVKADDKCLDLKAWQRFCDQRLAMRPYTYSQIRREALAVQWAAVLLQQVGQPRSKTRNGKWARLAAILHGDRNIDLFHYLKTYQPLRRAKPGTK
jgi:hypothetical protein